MVEIFNKAKSVFGVIGLLLALAFIIYFGVVANSTQPEMNFNNKTGEVYFSNIPPDVVVIPDFIDTGEFITLIVMFIGVMYAALRYSRGELDWISAEEAAKACEDYYAEMRRRREPLYMWNKIEFNTSNYLSWTRLMTGEPNPKRWVLWSKVFYPESMVSPPQYIKTYVYPFVHGFDKPKIMGTVISLRQPSDQDICSRCGKEYNERPVMTPELQEFKDVTMEKAKAVAIGRRMR